MAFSDEEYFEVIQSNNDVKEAYESIKIICNNLKIKTNCPDQDIDEFLKFISGKWNT